MNTAANSSCLVSATRSRTERALLLCAISLALAGCAAPAEHSPNAQAPPPGPQLDASPVIGDARPWSKWTPSAPASLPLPADTVAFAYWQLEGSGEPFWVESFACLDAVRARAGSTIDASISTLLTALEPEPGTTRADVTFVTGSTPTPWEGLVLRTWASLGEGATPTLAVAMLRRVGDTQPTRVVLWGQPGFAQAPAFTATLELRDEV
ncbi:MAG: hypothetical protein AAGI01_00620, partial [Myxococcota bacterium]